MTDSGRSADGPLLGHGVHLVGSIPLRDAEQVFRSASETLGSWLRRVPDGETGPRSDWIVWQYPVLSSRPEFEVAPPGVGSSDVALPRLRLREDADASTMTFESLGYADAALASYGTFARLKRDGVIPDHCRFQVSLPTPLAPIVSFVDPDHQAAVEPVYEASMAEELGRILDAIPHDQLAIQWDANVEFGLLDGTLSAWFADVRGGINERLLRLSHLVPDDVELGYHLCTGNRLRRSVMEGDRDARNVVDVANALSASLGRSLTWLHLPAAPLADPDRFFEPFAELSLRPETELYLGLVNLADGVAGATNRVAIANRFMSNFGVATPCGWGRQPPRVVQGLLQLQAAIATPVVQTVAERRPFEWPDGFERIPQQDWVRQPVDDFGLAYDHVDKHGWYRNLDPTVEELSRELEDGDLLLDYSGGTGILLDRLLLRIFNRQVGTLIVDSSARFLRVAVEKFAHDPRVAVRLLRFLRDEKRLQRLDEVLDPALLERGVDAIVSTNAIHLYPDLDDTVSSWAHLLRPDGKLFINSGNIRNPRAKPNEWILDETVWVINNLAEGIVTTDPRYAAYRPVLDDADAMKAHAQFRDRVFLEPRPLDVYVDALERNGFALERVREATIRASVEDWYEFITAYHDAVLGWVGGSEKVDGRPPTQEAVQDRLALIRQAIDTLFGGRSHFQACWTYITCHNAE